MQVEIKENIEIEKMINTYEGFIFMNQKEYQAVWTMTSNDNIITFMCEDINESQAKFLYFKRGYILEDKIKF